MEKCTLGETVANNKQKGDPQGDPHAEHHHIKRNPISLGHDVGMMGVLIHVLGDALNNIGVIIAALVIWLAKYDGKYYADPGVGIAIALLILASAYPLGMLLLRLGF